MWATIGLKDQGFAQGIKDATGKTESLTGGVKGLIQTVGGISLVSKSFQMIGNSIGAAVARYDTLNRFPQMLQAMGFEASATEAATQKLSASIAGLPTKLDDIVSTAQNLTVLTGNLELSTDTALALNNAFLASGASSADASRGMQQYTQQLAKGTVDMQSWRTMQETMGYALRETAEAMGFTGQTATNDLYKALQNGTVTFDQFNKKIIELSKRTGGFADMAKSASAGIGTSFTNMQTAIVRGVTAVISALDKNRNIQIFIESVGKGFENLLKTLGSVASIATTVLAPALWILSNGMGAVLAVIGPLTAAFIAYRATLVITSIVQALAVGFNLMEAAMLALPVIMNLVTAAQTALNVAMTANPVGLVVAGIALLVTGLIALYNWLSGTKKAQDDTTTSTNKLTDSLGKNAAAAGTLAQSNEEIAQSFDTASKGAEKFADQTFKTYSEAAKALREYEKEQREARYRIEQDEQGHLKVVSIQNEKHYNERKAFFDTYLKDVAETQRRGYADIITKNKDLYKVLQADWHGSPQIGVDYAKGIEQGLISKIPAIREAAKRVAAELEKATKAGLQMKSPSRIAVGIGKLWDNSLAKGLIGGISNVRNAATQVARIIEEFGTPSLYPTALGDSADFGGTGTGEEIITETTTIDTGNDTISRSAGIYNDHRVMNLSVNGIEELNALVDWWNNQRLRERAAGMGV